MLLFAGESMGTTFLNTHLNSLFVVRLVRIEVVGGRAAAFYGSKSFRPMKCVVFAYLPYCETFFEKVFINYSIDVKGKLVNCNAALFSPPIG